MSGSEKNYGLELNEARAVIKFERSSTMFYVQIGANGLDVRVKITDENVFTDCPVCGKPLDVTSLK